MRHVYFVSKCSLMWFTELCNVNFLFTTCSKLQIPGLLEPVVGSIRLHGADIEIEGLTSPLSLNGYFPAIFGRLEYARAEYAATDTAGSSFSASRCKMGLSGVNVPLRKNHQRTLSLLCNGGDIKSVPVGANLNPIRYLFLDTHTPFCEPER